MILKSSSGVVSALDSPNDGGIEESSDPKYGRETKHGERRETGKSRYICHSFDLTTYQGSTCINRSAVQYSAQFSFLHVQLHKTGDVLLLLLRMKLH